MSFRVRHSLPALALLGLLSSPAVAADVRVEGPWARATAAPNGAGAAFMTIVNDGAADKLIKAASPVAEVTELHTHLHEGGVMRMREVPAIDVAARSATRLAPGGLHVMLIGLKQGQLKEGESFPLTLTFEKAGTVIVTVPVIGPAAMGPSGGAAMPGLPEAGRDSGHGGAHGTPSTK